MTQADISLAKVELDLSKVSSQRRPLGHRLLLSHFLIIIFNWFTEVGLAYLATVAFAKVCLIDDLMSVEFGEARQV